MNTRDRLMSRASVAVMAAFAPKPEVGAADTSKVGQPEQVEDSGSDVDLDASSLSADEQAQFDAMQRGAESGAKEDIEPAGAAGDGGAQGGGGEDGDDGEPAAGDEPAPAAADGAADGAGKAPKTISYGKYQRELAKEAKKREDLEARIAAANGETAKEREARARLDERTKLLLEAINAKPAPAAGAAADADPEPDAEADPIGNLQWHNKRLAKQVQDLTTGRQQEQQQSAALTEEQTLYRRFEGDLTREAAADPTFADAFVHLRETRYRELGFIYADIDIQDPAQCKLLSEADQARLSDNIQKSFYQEQLLVAKQAIGAGKSPAKVVKNLALSRGFAPKAAPTAAEVAAAAAAPAGGAPPAKPAGDRPVAPVAAGSVKDQLQAIRDGQEGSRSLSDAGGSPGGTVTPERLADMSDDEFAEFYDSMPKGKFDRLLGKPAAS